MKVTNTERELIIEDAKIIFRHFSGEKDNFHPEGDRDFCVELDPETCENYDAVVAALEDEGWNIKTKEYEGGVTRRWINKVKVSYKLRAPSIFIVMRGADGQQIQKPVTQETIATLDYAEIESADMRIDKHRYGNNYEKCNGYLHSMYIKLVEDPLALKYAQ